MSNTRAAAVTKANKDLKELDCKIKRANHLGRCRKRSRASPKQNEANRSVSSSSDDSDDPEIEHDEVQFIQEIPSPKATPALTLSEPVNEPVFISNVHDIVSFLDAEITAEREEESLIEEITYTNIAGFNVITNQSRVRLYKNHNVETVLIDFCVNNCLSPTTSQPPSSICLPSLDVQIIKSSTERLCFKLSLEKTDEQDVFDIRVLNMCYLPNNSNNSNALLQPVYETSITNPVMHDKFRDFLHNLGLDQTFCRELINFATSYEHSLYIKLLIQTRDFIVA